MKNRTKYDRYNEITNAEMTNIKLTNNLQSKEQECEEFKKEKAEIKKYLGISDKTIIQRLEELQEFKDELKISEYNYKQALDEIEKFMIYEFSGQNQWVKKNVLDIINKAKEQ